MRVSRLVVWSLACGASLLPACSDKQDAASAHLVSSGVDFGSAGLAATVDRTITVRNDGGSTSGVLTVDLSGSEASEFQVLPPTAGQCETGVTTLAGGGSCDLPVRWIAGGVGMRLATLTFTADPGGTVQVALSGSGQIPRITVSKLGIGTVTSTPAGIECGDTCELVAENSTLTLHAATTNGSGYHFSGWTGACSGPSRDCTVSTVNGDQQVTANFAAIEYNLVFLSSVAFAMDQGSAEQFDARCNELATAAGINNATGDAYVAWVSSSTSSVISRLGGANGFVRVDGARVGGSLVSGLLSPGGNRVLNPISLDENGADPGGQTVLTGTLSDGSVSVHTCRDYTSSASSDFYSFGSSKGGPRWWTHDNVRPCSNTARVYCFMKTYTGLVPVPIAWGWTIWVTNTPYVPGEGQTPDQKCEIEKPDDVAVAKALISTTTQPASTALVSPQNSLALPYVRPDGQIVGTRYALLAAGDLRSGPWQQADGTYYAGGVWTGWNGDLTSAGPAGATCSDWTSNATGEVGLMGMAGYASSYWWSAGQASCTETSLRILCVEQ